MPISKRELWAGGGSLLLFVVSAVALAATLLAWSPSPPVHELHDYRLFGQLHGYRFFDLKVYRRAAEVVSQHRALYSAKLKHGLGFTYPPIAVLLFMALRWLSVRNAELVVTVINIALVAVVVHTALRLHRTSADARLTRPTRLPSGRVVAGWLAAAAVLWVEPITTTLGYGQIDLLIAALVVVDLVFGRRSRFGGMGIGLAAALKLTPLIFIPYLAFTGRGRMATRAIATFALSIVVSFAVIPRDASAYWLGGKFMDLSRVTGRDHLAGSGAANQSLRGALLRIFPSAPHQSTIWLLACLVVGSVGLLLAVRAARRGDEAWGFMLTAVTGLLVSPVSWTHHWAIAVAGTVAIVGVRGRPMLSGLRAVAALAFGIAGSAIWLIIRLGPGSHPGTRALLLGNMYVLAGVGVIATATLLELYHAARRRTGAARRPSFAPLVPAGRAPTLTAPQLVAGAPGHPGDPVRAITTSQARAPDRQSH